MARITKQDKADEKQRSAALKKARKELMAHFKLITADNFARLLAITDDEWKAAEETEAPEL